MLQPWSVSERAKIAPPELTTNDRFGGSVALSLSNILISGSPGEDSVVDEVGRDIYLPSLHCNDNTT